MRATLKFSSRCVSVLMLCVCIAACYAGTVTSTSDPKQEVRLTLDRFITAFNNLEWNDFSAALADDITVFNPDIPEAPSIDRLDGREKVEAGFRSVFAASRKGVTGPPYLHIQPRNVAIQLEGSVAVVTFEFDREQNSVGRRTIVFRHQAGGWKIIHIHASNTGRR